MQKRLNTLGVFALMVIALSIPIAAQSRRAEQPANNEKKPALPPIALVNNPAPEYLSGEVSVSVRGNENPIIRLGLAPNGVTLVEFPFSDRFFAINPGNPDLVTIEDSPTKETDRFFVMRPGSGFAPALEGAKGVAPATSIIVQMSSGMVVTFLLYPVRDIERNAHRCVVMYEREAIVNARRSAGLAINLDRPTEMVASKQPPNSIRMTPVSEATASSVTQSAEKKTQANASASSSTPPLPNDFLSAKIIVPPVGHALPVVDRKEKWSKTVHGLKVAVQTCGVDAKQQQVLVSVRNTLSVPVKLMPNHPELQVQTLDDKGRVLQYEPVARLKLESSTSDGMIAPGQIARYLITYEAPVLGARQRLGVAVAQTNAADEPVLMELTAGMR